MVRDLPVVRADDVDLTDLGDPAAGDQLGPNLKVHRVDALSPVAQQRQQSLLLETYPYRLMPSLAEQTGERDAAHVAALADSEELHLVIGSQVTGQVVEIGESLSPRSAAGNHVSVVHGSEAARLPSE